MSGSRWSDNRYGAVADDACCRPIPQNVPPGATHRRLLAAGASFVESVDDPTCQESTVHRKVTILLRCRSLVSRVPDHLSPGEDC